MKRILIAALMFAATCANANDLGRAVNPMDSAPVLVLKGCPAGSDWAIEPGGVAFCRVGVMPAAAPVVEPPVVAEALSAQQPAAAPQVAAMTTPAAPDMAPIPLPSIVTAPATDTSSPTPLPADTAPVASAPQIIFPAPTSIVVADSSTSGGGSTVAAGPTPTGPVVGATCNNRDWLTVRSWSDGHSDFLYVPAWMNHDSSTPYIDPNGVQQNGVNVTCA